MSGFDDPGIFYSDSFGGDTAADEGKARKSQLQRRFKEFLRQYRVGTDRTGFTFKYRCGPERGGRGRGTCSSLCLRSSAHASAQSLLVSWSGHRWGNWRGGEGACPILGILVPAVPHQTPARGGIWFCICHTCR